MNKTHKYDLTVKWTGNKGSGTSSYRAYDRDHSIIKEGKADIAGSSDPAFRGDSTRHNPEELLVASVSSCHMLWFLHLCSQAGVLVTDYEDHPVGHMEETREGGGRFTEIVLHPRVTVSEESMTGKLDALHHRAGELCFIANSCNFPIRHEPVCLVKNKQN
ncbi:OsmC family protein [Sinomicrobium weinanense]|uniref:OsmC family protein n=1 Tax=Sinomicrobium weinanense TaxID=2842200 RepID=A0A926JSP6_9FLAO|nr:OsmC family protein [Sinomicrobium weinanense]MBC9796563.1 OsmC family protein [Sinomicrobium weinanense]MBU3123050.1 OsmC family protein [Sinomicrobium weinanense]